MLGGRPYKAWNVSLKRRTLPKPAASAYAGLCAAFGIDPARALFADDMARNLKPAAAIGMTTLWVDNGSEQGEDADRSFIHYTTGDVTEWLHDALGGS